MLGLARNSLSASWIGDRVVEISTSQELIQTFLTILQNGAYGVAAFGSVTSWLLWKELKLERSDLKEIATKATTALAESAASITAVDGEVVEANKSNELRYAAINNLTTVTTTHTSAIDRLASEIRDFRQGHRVT